MKKESSSNLLAYLGIFVLLLFIILPPLLRVLVPKEEENTPTPINPVIMKLTCTKNEAKLNYDISRTVESIYESGDLTKTVFTYEVTFGDEELTMDDVVLDDYSSFKKISGADVETSGNKYTVTFNYATNDYSNNKLLSNHRQVLSDQLNYYSEEDYNCTTERQN